MAEFKVGDRVEWFSDNDDNERVYPGTIVALYSDGQKHSVKFDRWETTQAHHKDRFRLIPVVPKTTEGPFYVFTVPNGLLKSFDTLEAAEDHAKKLAKDYAPVQGIFTGVKAFKAINEVQEVPLA